MQVTERRMGQKVLSAVLPSIAAARITPDVPIRTVEDWVGICNSLAGVDHIAETLFESDVERIRHLETKLGSHTTFLAVLAPIVASLGAVALRDHRLFAGAFVLLAGVNVVVTYLVVLNAYSAKRTHLPFPEHLAVLVDLDPKPDPSLLIAARRLWSMEQNQPLAIELNNFIWAAQRSIQYAVVLLAIGAVATLA
jgi:hypothetical protein